MNQTAAGNLKHLKNILKLRKLKTTAGCSGLKWQCPAACEGLPFPWESTGLIQPSSSQQVVKHQNPSQLRHVPAAVDGATGDDAPQQGLRLLITWISHANSDLLQVWNVYGHLLNQCVCKRQNTTSSIVLNGLATSDGVVFDTLCFFFLEFPSKCFHVWYSSEYRGCLPVAPVQSWHRSHAVLFVMQSPADLGKELPVSDTCNYRLYIYNSNIRNTWIGSFRSKHDTYSLKSSLPDQNENRTNQYTKPDQRIFGFPWKPAWACFVSFDLNNNYCATLLLVSHELISSNARQPQSAKVSGYVVL